MCYQRCTLGKNAGQAALLTKAYIQETLEVTACTLFMLYVCMYTQCEIKLTLYIQIQQTKWRTPPLFIHNYLYKQCLKVPLPIYSALLFFFFF